MILPVHDLLRARCRRCSPISSASRPPISRRSSSTTRHRARSAISRVPVAFELARRLRKAPRVIAQEIAAALGHGRRHRARRGGAERLPELSSSIAPAFLRARLALARRPRRPADDAGKTIVEHTAINPNKAAHIGHLRNSALGDTLVRAAALPRRAGRGAELHRRHRRAGRRRRRRLPRARRPGRSTACARSRRRDALRLLLLGSLRPRHGVVCRRDKARLEIRARDAARHRARRQRTRAASAPSSPTRIVRCHLEDDARG